MQRAPLGEVREAVLGLRRGKGMVLDPDDHDTWSAGSFFTNPVLEAADVPEGAPAWPQEDGLREDQRGLADRARRASPRDTATAGSPCPASTSWRSPTAVARRTEELLALAREVRDGVEAAYGIRLVNEPVLVGCTL